MESTPSEINTELRPIYKPTSKYNLQETIGLKNEKQRWLAYLEIMRECLYEKNVDFNSDYRSQKHMITAHIVRSFKKKAPDFPITAGDWAVKEMLVSTIQNKRYYLKKKKNELENNSRIPPRNSPPKSPALQDGSPQSPQAQQDPPFLVEPPEPRTDEQVQINPPEPRTDEQDQVNPPKRVRKQRENDKENQNNVPRKRGRKTRSNKST